MKTILIIGGGAAGLAAALTAARRAPSVRVILLEGLDRVGKKLLATGNGKCNLSNETISPAFYHSSNPQRLEAFLADMPTERSVDFFRELGLLCTPDSAGRIYPACRQASMVLDVLLLNLRRTKNLETVTGCKIVSLARKGKGFLARSADGMEYRGDAVILTAGGCAAPKQGSDGSGYTLAASLGHHCTPLHPCLVPLQCRGSIFKGLKGIRVHCTTTLYRGKKVLAAEYGELQFTDYGLSGIPALQLSCCLTGENTAGIDLFPDWSFQTLCQAIRERIRLHPQEPLEDALLGMLHKRVQYALLNTLSIKPTAPANRLSCQQLELLAATMKDWRFPVTGTLSWEHAQVTGGGISLEEVNPDFSSRRCPGLYLAGEVLDVAGSCGGYNLHWAWCSGIKAGQSAVHDR